ncbi:hypothetical protein [Streptomyces heilongjiangensis]|uniref:Uncharacterized protein n=1 Tax=Streptomyces heilongjiangensis TaxID=945052 RepID=A0ABW1B5G3_9ACTN|nr:hypothetical protein [Streptomyces heilongjiangensis]MDC2947138.1 hypothetical protein [Streptomyces heilongjiangensis]
MSQTEHYVLDAPTLVALGGDKQVSGLIHAAAASDDVRLWVPVLCLLEAERRRAGMVDHVGVLVDVLSIVDDDYAMTVTVAELGRTGIAQDAAAAVHAARPNGTLPVGALIATVEPGVYEGLGVGVMDLRR